MNCVAWQNFPHFAYRFGRIIRTENSRTGNDNVHARFIYLPNIIELDTAIRFDHAWESFLVDPIPQRSRAR